MKVTHTLRNLFYGTAAFATIAVMDVTDAAAQTVGQNVTGLTDDLQAVGKFTMMAAFLAGIFLMFQGVLKLKESHDNEGRTKMSAGFWRLGLGAIAVALGVVSGVLTNTLGLGVVGPQTTQAPF